MAQLFEAVWYAQGVEDCPRLSEWKEVLDGIELPLVCRQCGEKIKDDWKLCPYCGEDLLEGTNRSSGRSICSKCGCTLAEDWISCPNCGQDIKDTQLTGRTVSEGRSRIWPVKNLLMPVAGFGILLIIILVAQILPGFSPQSLVPTSIVASETPTPSVTPSTTATKTVSPTSTRRPTNTARPTRTYTPTISAPFPVSDILLNPKLVWYDNFETSTNAWGIAYPAKISFGNVFLMGSSDWGVNFGREGHPYYSGQGFIVKYKFSTETTMEYYIQNGDWQTAGLKRFGVYHNMFRSGVQKNTWIGSTNLSGIANIPQGGSFQSRITWYWLMLAIGKNGDFVITIWSDTDPFERLIYREKFEDTWSSLAWQFGIGANSGEIYLDEFADIKFDAIRK